MIKEVNNSIRTKNNMRNALSKHAKTMKKKNTTIKKSTTKRPTPSLFKKFTSLFKMK